MQVNVVLHHGANVPSTTQWYTTNVTAEILIIKLKMIKFDKIGIILFLEERQIEWIKNFKSELDILVFNEIYL